MAELISIIIPCYNQAEYLSETLQSVLDQTYTNWECVIVDDESPDNTWEIAQEWTKKDTRFKYLRKQNGGLSDARNAGIEIANGEWILPLDSDDKIGEDYLSLACQIMVSKPNIGLIYAKACFFGCIEGEWQLVDYSFEKLLLYNHIYCSAFFKKQDWVLTGGYDTNLKQGREDWEFWINLLSKTQREVCQLDYIGFFYRRKNSSMDCDLNDDKSKIRNIEQYIYKKHIDIYTKYFGTPQEFIHQKSLSDKRLQYIDNRMLRIRNNPLTRILNAMINRLI